MTEVWHRRREHRLFVVVVVVVTGVTVASVFYYLGYRAATGRTTVGDLAIGGLAIRALLQLQRGDPERILGALRTAGGDRLLAGLPEGLETRLGRKSWDGTGLSGGQWQTVANARAAMRQAPLLRVLDEPSASLDARAEEWLFRQYADLSRLEGGVTVLVTHRFTTARAADLIVVLDGGRVLEVGTHDTLSRADGLYAELFRLQARYFV
jgi:ATP-binding cassette, subfamily B, bacterial